MLQVYFQALLRWGLWEEIVSDRDGTAGSDCVPGLLPAGAARDQSGPNGRIAI